MLDISIEHTISIMIATNKGISNTLPNELPKTQAIEIQQI